jgi:hypothetical protein
LPVIDNNHIHMRAKVKWQDNKNAGFYAGLTMEIRGAEVVAVASQVEIGKVAWSSVQ